MSTSEPSPAHEQTVRRPFGWGVLFIGDSEAQPVEVDPHAAVTWGREDEAVAVLVRHAQDVDAEVLDGLGDEDDVPLVEVTVTIRWTAAPAPDSEGVLAVPSGLIIIGDAERQDVVAVSPGRWRVQVTLEPSEHAEQVGLWLTPVS